MKPEYAPKTLTAKLGKLVEECGEVLAAAGKTMRWGLGGVNPELPQPSETNQQWLLRELNDLEESIGIIRAELAPASSPVTATDAGDGDRIKRAFDNGLEAAASMVWAAIEGRGYSTTNEHLREQLAKIRPPLPAQPVSGEVATPAAAKAPGHEQARALIERLSHPSTRETLEKCLGDLTAYVSQQEARDRESAVTLAVVERDCEALREEVLRMSEAKPVPPPIVHDGNCPRDCDECGRFAEERVRREAAAAKSAPMGLRERAESWLLDRAHLQVGDVVVDVLAKLLQEVAAEARASGDKAARIELLMLAEQALGGVLPEAETKSGKTIFTRIQAVAGRASALPPGVAELIAEWRALGSDQQGALMNLQEFPGQSPRTNEINSVAARLLRALVQP